MMYLTMWGVEDGLTSSTVFPHLKILAGFKEIDNIFFYTFERGGKEVNYTGPSSSKIKFTPFYSRHFALGIVNKILDFTLFPYLLIKFCRKNKVDVILARGAPVGSVAWMVHSVLGIPYYVESFEPHADYMLDARVWGARSAKFVFQKWWEKKQKQTATGLLPVSFNYKKQLISEGVLTERIEVIPCCVNLEDFKYDAIKRKDVRVKLGIADTDIVGIYVGKFGGIYYTDDAFRIFKKAFDFWGDSFQLIILTPQPKEYTTQQLLKFGISPTKVFTALVKHTEIPDYLSAADFAYSLAMPLNSNQFLSPIKDGEYWANGLPIMISENIGDDSNIIKANPGAGVVFSIHPDNLSQSYKTLDTLFKKRSRAEAFTELQQVASKYRHFSIAENVYRKLFAHN